MKKNILKNIIMLYGLSIAKIIFPLITLPYLTRVLSVDMYGTVSYVKTIMTYLQLTIDFGFMLSGTKDIVEAKQNNEDIGKVAGDILLARIILGIIAGCILIIMTLVLPILKECTTYTFLSYVAVFLSVFLFEFIFRGLEEMHIVTWIFITMKGIAACFTFVFIHGDSQILWIPLLDIVGTFFAVVFVLFEMNKRKIKIRCKSLKKSINKLIESAIYFISDMATTAFGAFNTLLIGAFLPKVDIAYWTLCITMTSAVQALYSPINSGIYPDMIKTKNINIIKKILKIFMPIVIVGCIFTFVISKYALLIIGGEQYIGATNLLRALIPVLFFSFPAMLVGWPTLGAIGKIKEVTLTTVFTAILQIVGLIVLITINQFEVIQIALLRGATEFFMLMSRSIICLKNKDKFNYF